MTINLDSIVTSEQVDRQVRIWGREKQKKIDDSKVLVIGSGILPQMILSNLAGLGIGNIFLMDNARISRNDPYEFLCFKNQGYYPKIGAKKVKEIAITLKKINPLINIGTRFSKFVEPFAHQFRPDLIIDATNSPISKENCLYYANSYKIPFISASSKFSKGTLSCYNPSSKIKNKFLDLPDLESYIHQEYESEIQGNFSSGVIGGLVTDEIRKLLFSITDDSLDNPLEKNKKITYNINCQDRTSAKNSFTEAFSNDFRGNSALVVGAGAVGNFVALNLALMGVRNIDIIDYDIIEITNLNRQILFYDKIGQPKAKILNERIKEINKNVISDHYNEAFDKKLISNKQYDVIFSGVDRNTARYEINKYAIEKKIPLIESGCSATEGNLSIYAPGNTPCIDCQNNLSMSLDQEKKQDALGCARDPNASVVVPNIIMGSLMVGEYVNLLYKSTRPILDKTLRFDSFSKEKIFLDNYIPPKNKCKCRM